MCPNSEDGQHETNVHVRTKEDGSQDTVTDCNKCGMEW